jgi:hypothetical protein
MDANHSLQQGHHRKRWTAYLSEFLMLFLAVFLGFIAENIREEMTERHREKEYIESMVKDLKTDTASLTNVIETYKVQIMTQDTLLKLFELSQNVNNDRFLELLSSVRGFPDFIYADATIQQLKNSGGFRLIKNNDAVDSINAYTSQVDRSFVESNAFNHWLQETTLSISNYISFLNYNKALGKHSAGQEQSPNVNLFITYDKAEQQKFYNRLYLYAYNTDGILKTVYIPLRERAARLITFLKKEYHLDTE